MRFFAAVVFALLMAIGFGSPALAGGLQFEELKLKNGWEQYPGTRVPAVAMDADKVVHLRGGVRNGAQVTIFRLPKKYRPIGGAIYVTTNLYASAPGRLWIAADGWVKVETDGDIEDAISFTSLEVSFSKR